VSEERVDPSALSHDDVVAMLAAFGQRPTEEVTEQIGSLELTWLITMIEQQYGVTLDLDDAELEQMTTITGAVSTLRSVLAGAEHV